MAKKNDIGSLSGYELMRAWFDFCFENQDKINASHTAMFAWFVELNNRMGWTKCFGSPAGQTMSAIGIKSYNTYKKIFDELVGFGFVKVISESKNQWTSCVIALSKNNKAINNALDKALARHLVKQDESTSGGTSSIIKPLNLETFKPLNKETKGVPSEEENFELIVKVMTLFGFTETANYDKMRDISIFLKILSKEQKIDYFREQFDAYAEFKKPTPQYLHAFPNFIGTMTELYLDGAWNEENWKQKLETEKKSKNGTIKQTRAGRGSNQTVIASGSYSKL